ncbi:MAG: acetyl/propionyl/methylcrotonyl-CoA carboxylase subunit alpha [Aestuariivita sp.]|nr:acetyl/propionyl/methylcrotonyl-CoA carboxylase subunit alpha [Aestuariivita sp.]
MFNKLLIANRGEIACRIIKSARRLGITTVAVYSDADQNALHVRMADEAIYIGHSPSSQSYIAIEKVIKAVQISGAEAVHPGYGFLSENPRFAQALEKIGVVFVGPPVSAIKKMGDKITSKKIAIDAGVNTIPGYLGLIKSDKEAVKIAKEIDFPVMIKASAGGGGKGMRIAHNEQEVREGFQSAKNEAVNSFGDDRIFIEKFITQPRHIEIQILSDSYGNCIFLGERECSIQRRNQKIIEEAPSSFIDEATRNAMGNQAVSLAKAVNYASAGTVEFIVDEQKNFYFLEMNTRLQVEHPITELITGIDLVEKMLRIANGEKLSLAQSDVVLNGWAFENRIYAEDPFRNFLPSIGRLTRYRPPEEVALKSMANKNTLSNATIVRNDTGVYEGGEISIHYDPMIAKLCTWGHDRASAIGAMQNALDRFEIEGIGHNLPFVAAVMEHPRFQSGNISTAFIDEEYPDGFHCIALTAKELECIVACCTAMHHISERRRMCITGRMTDQEKPLGNHWVVSAQAKQFTLDTKITTDSTIVEFKHGNTYHVECNWIPGETVTELIVNDENITLKINKITRGFRVRYRSADLNIKFRSPRQAELAALMPDKVPPDTSKLLLCPMPGLVVSIDVVQGKEVQEGQTLCTIEAMKMENILKAERTGVVKRINVSPQDILAVDDVILEFE